MKARGVGTDFFSVRAVAATEVPSYLAAADAGLAFNKPCVSRIASSPTKNGEYLACGLPLIINTGIGDCDSLVNDWRAGVLVSDFTEDQYELAADSVEAMAAAPGAREKLRSVAEQLFDLESVAAERYASLYERVLSS
jgi:glycosyltransferase involved in cell wall biosynthesis